MLRLMQSKYTSMLSLTCTVPNNNKQNGALGKGLIGK